MRSTPGAALAGGEQAAMDLGLGADVEAAGRLVGEHEARRRGRARGRGSASGYCRRRAAAPARPAPGSARRSRGSPSRRGRGCAPKRRKPPRWKRGSRISSSATFSATVMAPTTPSWWRSSGMRAMPDAGEAPRVVAGERPRRTAASSRQPAAQGRRQARQAPPGRCRRRRRCRRSRPRRRRAMASSRPRRWPPPTLTRSSSKSGRPGSRGVRRLAGTSRPTIISAMFRRSASAVAISPTFLPPRSTAMRCETASTSPSLWEMKITARPLAASERTVREQAIRLGRGQHRGRLVEDQDAGVAVERLEDLDALALADREPRDLDVEIDGEAGIAHHRLDLPARRAGAAAEAEDRLGAEHDVLEPGEVLGQREVLVDHADAGSERGMGRARRQRDQPAFGAGDLHRAGIGDVVAEEDVHQRRLAGAVLAEQGEDLAAAQGEVDAVIGEQRPEALGDAGEAKDDGRLAHGRPRPTARHPSRRRCAEHLRMRTRVPLDDKGSAGRCKRSPPAGSSGGARSGRDRAPRNTLQAIQDAPTSSTWAPRRRSRR